MYNVEVYIYAKDQDHALELLGNGADSEFETLALAKKGYDSEVHEGRKIYRVTVEEVAGCPVTAP